jgi:hypothetical protein
MVETVLLIRLSYMFQVKILSILHFQGMERSVIQLLRQNKFLLPGQEKETLLLLHPIRPRTHK